MVIMQFLYRVFSYLRNLEWSEKKKECIFCDERNFKDIVYQDEEIIAVKNIRSAGEEHILILPRTRDGRDRHIRDIEALRVEDLPLLRKLDEVKNSIIQQSYSQVPALEIHSGYHRGRRPLPFFSKYYWPDIISVHHLHLHVIIRPRLSMWLFKYPAHLRLMWKSDIQVMDEIKRKAAASQRRLLLTDSEQLSKRQTSSVTITAASIGTRLYRRTTGFQELP